MARLATVEDIVKAGEREFPIPGLFGDDGEPLKIRLRKVHAGERNALLPRSPGHLFDKLPEDKDERDTELKRREAAWLEQLSPEQLEARRLEAADFSCRLVSLAALEPKLTVAEARALGDGALALAAEILEFSRNDREAPKPTSGASE
jgi:hypothetical protein